MQFLFLFLVLIGTNAYSCLDYTRDIVDLNAENDLDLIQGKSDLFLEEISFVRNEANKYIDLLDGLENLELLDSTSKSHTKDFRYYVSLFINHLETTQTIVDSISGGDTSKVFELRTHCGSLEEILGGFEQVMRNLYLQTQCNPFAPTTKCKQVYSF